MITIVDYGMGNLGSIFNMLKKIGVPSQISNDAAVIDKAQKIILPGVGAFGTGMQKIREFDLQQTLNRKALDEKVPILGICLGMQLMCNYSEEGNCSGLGWIDADVVKFAFDKTDTIHKTPHIGWNYVKPIKPHFMTKGMDNETRFYFVHSYYVRCHNPDDAMTTTDYGIRSDSSFASSNIMGVQFHPEKSHRFGMDIFRKFSQL